MIRAIVYGLILIAVSLPLNAAVYKWVDDNGQTHFSQTPPLNNETRVPGSLLDPRLGASKIEAVESGQKVFCGELLVLSSKISDDLLAERIRQNIDDWRRQRQAAERERNAGRKQQQRYAEQDCRVRWAYQTLQRLRSFEYNANKQYKSLQEEYKALEARRDEECPADAKKLGKSILVGKEANEWGKCHDRYRYKLRDLRHKMKENRKSLSDVK